MDVKKAARLDVNHADDTKVNLWYQQGSAESTVSSRAYLIQSP